MLRKLLLPCLLLVCAFPALAAEAPYALLLVQAAGRGTAAVPVTATVDFAAITTALGVKGARLTLPVTAAYELTGGKLEPVPVQFDPQAPGATAGELTLLLPPAIGPQRLRVYFSSPNPVPAVSAPRGLTVTTTGGAITVQSSSYRVTHEAKKQGGLPSRIQFLPSGKVSDNFSLNDRIYRQPGGYTLAQDPDPQVELLAAGPLRAKVRVRARYLQDGQAPPSHPRAEYCFTYYAGSPLVRVSATATQDTAQPWDELHLFEFNVPDASFTHWLTGRPAVEGDLVANSKGTSGGAYGGLSSGNALLAVVGSPAMIYDGRGGYGTYVHGPWVSWNNTCERLQVALFVGEAAPAQAAATLDQAAEEAAAGEQAVVTVKTLETARQSLETALAGLPPATAARWRWLAALARRLGGEAAALPRAVTLTGSLAKLAGQCAPVTAGEKLLSSAAANQLSLLSNRSVGWAFARHDKALRPLSCFDFSSGTELLSATEVSLWELQLQRPDKATLAVDAGAGRASFASPRAGQAELVWTLPAQQGGARVRVLVTLDGPAAAFTLKLEGLAAGWSVRSVSYPQVAAGQIGATPDDDALLLPQGSGVLHRAPLRHSVQYSGNYPDGWCTFQMMAYYGPRAGLYVACHDPLASTKQVVTRRTADGAGQVLAYLWHAPDAGVPDNGFAAAAPTVVRPFRGDWFDATQLYRAWAEKEAQWWPRETAWDRPDTPRWMREVCVWALGGGPSSECVKPVKEFAAAMGAPTAFHWYSWHEIPFDVKYPHYFPTKPGMIEGVKQLQAAGVRVMPYINGRLWDTQLEDFQQTAVAAATKGEDGKPYIEEYGSGAKLAPMCPTQKLWQDKVQEIVLRLVTEIGVDGVYIDQVGAASPRLCMDKSHGHPLAGGHWWTQGGYWPMLTALQSKLPPEKMITTECNAEAYARLFDGYLTWHWQFQDQVPAFPALYAGRVQLFSRAYNGGDQQAHWMRIGQQLVFGEQLGWISPDMVLRNPDTRDFLSRAARTRHALLDFLAWGRMARPPTVAGSIPQVSADWAWSGKWVVSDSALQRGAWWAGDGRLLLLFANTSGEQVSAEVLFRPADYGWPAKAKLTLTPVSLDGKGKPEAKAGSFRLPLSLEPRGLAAFELAKQ